MGKNKLKSYPLRIEEDTKEKLKIIAKKTGRKELSKEIDYVLNKYVENYEAEHGEIEINSQD